MNVTPSGQPDNELNDFIEKLELYCRDEEQPILALLKIKVADDEWCNKTTDYLITNCGAANQNTTSFYITVLDLIQGARERKDNGKLFQFAKNKLSEVEMFIEKANSLNKEELNDLYTTTHTVIWLIKSIGSHEAIALMERLHEENKDNEYGWLTGMCLAYMKKK